jgi:AcrR family transcriptional regulator
MPRPIAESAGRRGGGPEVSQPGAAERDVTGPRVPGPDVREPDVAGPGVPGPDVPEPDIAGPGVPGPDVPEPDVTGPGVREPDATQPDITQPDVTETAILDAAVDCVLAFGVRRTSLSDVARRAGVSRPTVYRRWPDLTALVADVMTREWLAAFAAAQPDLAGFGTVREFAVSYLVAVVATLRTHPLLRKIIDVDPELLQPYIFDRLGTGQRLALQFAAERIADGQRDGSVRDGDPQLLALMVLLTVQSFVFSGRVAASAAGTQRVDAELADLLDRYLRPLAAG